VAEIPRDRAKSLLAQGLRRAQAEERAPEGAAAFVARLGPAAALGEPEPRFPPGEDERALVDDSARLHELPVIRGWVAEESALRALALKLDEIAVSPLYIDEKQRAEQMRQAVVQAIDDHFDAPRRAQLAARLFASAEHLIELGDPAKAAMAAAVARA